MIELDNSNINLLIGLLYVLIPISILIVLYCLRKLLGVKLKVLFVLFALFILTNSVLYLYPFHSKIESSQTLYFYIKNIASIVSILTAILCTIGAFKIARTYFKSPYMFEKKMTELLAMVGVIKVMKHRIDTKKIMKEFKSDELSSIYWNELFDLEQNVWYQLNDKVRFKKVFQDENKMVWITQIKAGGKFGLHKHPNCLETCKVIIGDLKDNVVGFHIYKGESYTYPRNSPHLPESSIDTALEVTFIK
jgi:mannose-6-phosphate isomerase-like protein (cupin superfamily)